jgi:hypothetical protein
MGGDFLEEVAGKGFFPLLGILIEVFVALAQEVIDVVHDLGAEFFCPG